MKKKMAAWSLCSAALVLLLCSCALAFSKPADETPADQSIARVEKMSFVIPEEGNYPACVLVVEKMLYDGQNLLIGYRTEGEAIAAIGSERLYSIAMHPEESVAVRCFPRMDELGKGADPDIPDLCPL